MPLGAVMGGAAILGAGATIYSGSKAASAQKKAAGQSIDEQRRQYDLTRSDFAPWRVAGGNALDILSRASGINGQPPDHSLFYASPEYEWRRTEGQRGIERSAAARGQLASGATMKALSRFNQGQAAGEYGDWWNRLGGIAGIGLSGASGTAQAGMNASNNISQAYQNAGNARASSYANMGSAVNSGINNILFAYLNSGKGGF